MPPALPGIGEIPRVQSVTRTENVIDARVCVLSGCRFLERMRLEDGRPAARCAAQVFHARLPADKLLAEARENRSPAPDPDGLFLLRLLMAPECVRPECGVTSVTHTEKIVLPSELEAGEDLFPAEPAGAI